jgi:NAD(P)-dependent dehydrogenase (short-subunit alcohol dehydrogenase family)
LVPRPDLARDFETTNPLGRVGEHGELADLASFLLSDRSGYINGEVVTIDGGQWLQGAGQFNFLKRLTDEDWAAIRPKKSS